MKKQTLVVKIADNTVWNVFDTFTSDGTIANTKFLLYDEVQEKFVWDAAANYTAYNGQQNTEARTYLPVDLFTATFYLDGALLSTQVVRYPNKVVKPADPTAPTGYTFYGWYTDEECTILFDFVTTVIDENTSLYSQILVNTHTINYTAGDGTGTAPVDVLSPYDYGDEVTILAPTGIIPPADKLFDYWTYIQGEVSHNLMPGDVITMPDYDIELIAQFATAIDVTYDANTGTGTMVDANSPYLPGEDITVKANEFVPPTDYLFSRFNSAANGSGLDCYPGDILSASADVTLYAIWSNVQFTLAYDANGGTGTLVDASSPYVEKQIAIVKSIGGIAAPEGFEFDSWNTQADGLGISYAPASDLLMLANSTLYAIWHEVNEG